MRGSFPKAQKAHRAWDRGGTPGELPASQAGRPHQLRSPKEFRSFQTSVATFFHTGKDIQEKAKVSQALSDVPRASGGGCLIQISAHWAKCTNGTRTLSSAREPWFVLSS